MTNKEKQLLLKDLCARLPYDVIVQETFEKAKLAVNIWNCGPHYIKDHVERVKPYLRPMSSMTEKEIEEYRNLSDEVVGNYGSHHYEFTVHCVRLGIKPTNPHECVDNFLNMEAIDWLNAHHFDYRGLIDKGLALEAPEGMYNFK